MNNQYDYSRTILYSPFEDSFCKCDVCVEKPKTITTQGEFRDLPRRRVIHCPYCSKPMIAVGVLYDMKRNGVFSGPIKEFVRQVKPYEDCLKPGNKEVFKTIEKYAEQAPNTHLSRVIRLIHADSLKKLRQTQKPVFMEFVRATEELPPEYKAKMRTFLKKQKNKLLEIPYYEKFNADDFQYKAKRLAETVNNQRLKGLIVRFSDFLNTPAFDDTSLIIHDKVLRKIFPDRMNNNKIYDLITKINDKNYKIQLDTSFPLMILSFSNQGTHYALKKKFINEIRETLTNPDYDYSCLGLTREKAEKIAQLDYKNPLECQNLIKKDIKLYTVNEIRKTGEKLCRDDIVNLCSGAENMINEKPVIVSFKNKAFVHDLTKELEGLEGTSIFNKLMNIAKKLPTSKTDKNSFISNHKYSDSDTIGYYLLRPSVATIEHIKPTANGGKNNMGNWALACEFDNNTRSDMDMEIFLKHFDPQNPQLYFDDIIEAALDGEISFEDVLTQAQAFKTQGNVIIDTSKLKLVS